MTKQTAARAILIIAFLMLCTFGAMVKKAGERRQVRFNLEMIHKMMMEYYRYHHQYPESLAKFPKFYVVSPIERFYLDSKMLEKGVFAGYAYALTNQNGRFALCASPIGFWPFSSEFGITEKGILKENKAAVDARADSYEEVDRWNPYVLEKRKKQDKSL